MLHRILRLVLVFLCFSVLINANPEPGRGRPARNSKAAAKIPTVPPAPGRSGVHYDPKKKVVHVGYGDDIPQHQKHLQDWRKKVGKTHPRLLGPLPLAPKGSTKNRKQALAKHPKPPKGFVRDEKLPNSLANPHHAKTTSVRVLPVKESRKEGALLSKMRKVHTNVQKAHGVKPKVQLYANPAKGQKQKKTPKKQNSPKKSTSRKAGTTGGRQRKKSTPKPKNTHRVTKSSAKKSAPRRSARVAAKRK